MNHYDAEGGYVLDDSVPSQPGFVPGVYRVKLYGFNEPRAFGLEFNEGISVEPVSNAELDRIKATGMKYDLLPCACDNCRDLLAKLKEAEDLNNKLGEQLTELRKKNKK